MGVPKRWIKALVGINKKSDKSSSSEKDENTRTSIGQAHHRRNHSISIDDNGFQENGQTSQPAGDANIRPACNAAASPSTPIQVQCEAKDRQITREEWAATYIQTAFRGFLMKYLIATSVALKGVRSLLFAFGSTMGAYLLLLHLALATPILFDFYNYDADRKELAQLFVKFTQKSSALFGALLFFIGMTNSMPRRQAKKKARKSKTN